MTGVSSGNAPQLGTLTLKRTSAKGTLSHAQRGFAGADHEWKFGGSFEIGEHTQPQVIPGGVRYVDNNGQPFQMISSPPSNVGGRFVTSAVFGSDIVTIGSRVAISAESASITVAPTARTSTPSTAMRTKPMQSSAGSVRCTLERALAPRGRHDQTDDRWTNHGTRQLWTVLPRRAHR